MEGVAFCPAHITGFFRAGGGPTPESRGSVGAGFSIQRGVTTKVRTDSTDSPPKGMAAYVTRRFLEMTRNEGAVSIYHDVGVPAGYGLGSSGALALSTALALNEAFRAGLDRQQIGLLAHVADVYHNTGLGDVVAAHMGGFEVRTKPGGPGFGTVQNLDVGDPEVVVVCIAPRSTSDILRADGMINGIGGRMVERFLAGPSTGSFQKLSMEFATGSSLLTPAIEEVVGRIRSVGADCGVAMLGETVFAMTDIERAGSLMDLLTDHTIIRTRIDMAGARII